MKPSEIIKEKALKVIEYNDNDLRRVEIMVGCILDFLDEQHSKDGGK